MQIKHLLMSFLLYSYQLSNSKSLKLQLKPDTTGRAQHVRLPTKQLDFLLSDIITHKHYLHPTRHSDPRPPVQWQVHLQRLSLPLCVSKRDAHTSAALSYPV